jgi:hypothetical protein
MEMEIVNCGCILFPTLSKKYSYFAWFLVGSFLRIAVPYFLGLNSNEDINNNNDNNNDINQDNFEYLKILLTKMYLEMIRNVSSDLLIGIFHCFYLITNREKNKNKNPPKQVRGSRQISFIYNDETNKKSKMIKIIFLISFIDIVCQILLPITYIIESLRNDQFLTISADHLNSFLFLDILSRYFFSLCILNTYFYAHHYFAFLLNFISLSILVVIDYKFKFNKYDVLYITIIGIKTILYSLEDIINKVAFRSLYIWPITLIFYKGLFQLVIYLPIITTLFFVLQLNNFEDINIKNEVKLFISFIPFNIIRTINLVAVIDRFTAQHMSFLKVSEALNLFLFYLVIGEEKKFELTTLAYIGQIFAFIILLISTLIHNEIIIVNVKILKEKTEFYLGKDAGREQNSSNFSESLFSNSGYSINESSSISNSEQSKSDA